MVRSGERPIWFHAISGTEEHCEPWWNGCKGGETRERVREGDEGDKGALSRAISTAHCAMLVAHNSDPVQLGPFPTIQDYPLYWQDRPEYNRWYMAGVKSIFVKVTSRAYDKIGVISLIKERAYYLYKVLFDIFALVLKSLYWKKPI